MYKKLFSLELANQTGANDAHIKHYKFKKRTFKVIQGQPLPFILSFAIKRESSQVPQMEGYYSDDNDMWCDSETMLPVIDSLKFDSAELKTKTNVDIERDDESSFCLDIMTKTKVSEESDDTDSRSCIFNSLLTKTDVVQEKDDNSMSPYDI